MGNNPFVRGIIYIASFLLAFHLVLFQGVVNVHAPELFGGQAYIYRTSKYVLGYVDAWGIWLLVGKADANRVNCKLIHLAGEQISGVINGEVPCGMLFKSERKFVGWIDFRGHPRPFCGAYQGSSLPRKCMHFPR